MKFYGEAKFLGNGQYRARANGEEPSNRPGGAVLNAGTMQVRASVLLNCRKQRCHAHALSTAHWYGRLVLCDGADLDECEGYRCSHVLILTFCSGPCVKSPIAALLCSTSPILFTTRVGYSILCIKIRAGRVSLASASHGFTGFNGCMVVASCLLP